MFTRMREGKPRWQNSSARVRPDIGRWSFEEISPAYQNNSLRSTNGPTPVPQTRSAFHPLAQDSAFRRRDGRQFYSRSHDPVIRVYDAAGNLIETHEHKGESREP
jgi:hypothetical protein